MKEKTKTYTVKVSENTMKKMILNTKEKDVGDLSAVPLVVLLVGHWVLAHWV